MADVKTYGILYCSDGTEIALLNAATAESTAIGAASFVNLQTSTINNYNVSAADVGTAYPGKTIVASTPLQAENGVAAAYVLRAGQIINVLPVAKAGIVNDSKIMLMTGTQLQAGDKIMIKPLAAATRIISFAVYTQQGQYHIFEAKPTGAGDVSLVSIMTGNSLGDTLQGQNIVKSYVTSIDGAKLSSSAGGVLVISDKNEIVGAQVATSPLLAQPMFEACNMPVGLNFIARATTTS
tara:strand:- start:9 stop:722 length:714 start_codon:yes stop_codon:yes gene_type:complete